jgi:acetyl esterase/lipase
LRLAVMKTGVRNIFAGLAAACLAGRRDARFFIANLPAAFSSVSVIRDLPYGNGASKKLDLYIPKHTSQTPLPVIVFFHGGRWTYGEKAQYAFAAEMLAREGFIVAVPDYRKYSQVKFPVFVEDAAEAVAWVYDNIAARGGDADKLFLAGHSAGAHIGALVAADPRYLLAHRKDRSIIAGFAGLAGPYAFTPEDEDLKDMFGPPERYARMQAPTFIDGKQPPMLLLHGREDKTVKLYNLERLAAEIAAKGGAVETKIYPEIDHTQIVGALTVFLRHKAPVKDDIVRFIRTLMAERKN